MADEEDLRLALEGVKDLQRCDLRKAKFVDPDMRGRNFGSALLRGAVFERCNLTGSKFGGDDALQATFINCIAADCLFEGAHYNVSFIDTDLRNSRMKGIFVRCKFEKSNLKGTDFSGVILKEGNIFDDVEFDESTDFEKASGVRALSRLPLFQFFSFDRGIFTRSNVNDAAEKSMEAASGSDDDYVSESMILAQIARNSGNVRFMARSLAIAIDDQIADLPVPNDPVSLDRYNSFVGILKQVRDGLAEISRLLEASDGSTPQFEPAAGVVAALQERVAKWLRDNSDVVAGYGMKTGLLGAGCALLTYCGAPGWQAFPALAFMLGGPQLADTFRHKKPDAE